MLCSGLVQRKAWRILLFTKLRNSELKGARRCESLLTMYSIFDPISFCDPIPLKVIHGFWIVNFNYSSHVASLDEGERWQEIAWHLPTILSIEALDRR